VPNGRKAHLYVDGTNVVQMFDFVDINGGAIDGTAIGAAAASTGAFTNLSASGTLGVTGVATLGVGAVLNTPASVTLTNATGLPISTGVSGLGTGVATFLGTPSSTNLRTAVTDETGTGSLVFATSPTLVTPALGTPASGVVTNLTGTASININGTVGATTPNTGSFTVLTENAFPVVTQTDVGTAPNQLPLNQYLGNLAYQDAANIAGPVRVGVGTASPFAIDANGRTLIGANESYPTIFSSVAPLQISTTGGIAQSTTNYANNSFGVRIDLNKSRSTSLGGHTAVNSGDTAGEIYFSGSDATAFIPAARILAAVDGTPGTNDMPGRLVFSTTADGASSPTERMRIDNQGRVGIGGAVSNNKLTITGTSPLEAFSSGVAAALTFGAGVSSRADAFLSFPSVNNTSGTSAVLNHFSAFQGTFSTTVTNQRGFFADASLTGATNNYGFYSNVAAGSGRFNFYANGTAANFFAGDMQLDKTVTAGGTTGAQTINKNAGTVNFAAAATSLVVTDDRVTTSSIIICTVGTNDTTLKSVAAVAGAGSFTLHASAAATAETRVNFLIIN
jgi:hypothetical protein